MEGDADEEEDEEEADDEDVRKLRSMRKRLDEPQRRWEGL